MKTKALSEEVNMSYQPPNTVDYTKCKVFCVKKDEGRRERLAAVSFFWNIARKREREKRMSAASRELLDRCFLLLWAKWAFCTPCAIWTDFAHIGACNCVAGASRAVFASQNAKKGGTTGISLSLLIAIKHIPSKTSRGAKHTTCPFTNLRGYAIVPTSSKIAPKRVVCGSSF